KEMWTAIERLQQGESLNVQDVKTNLFWEFGKFTSRDGESIESYYSRFVTVVKQRQEIDTVSYHKLFDVLKQFQNKVNDIRSEKLARSANPLALLAAAQPNSDNYYEAPVPQRSNAPSFKQSSSTRTMIQNKLGGIDSCWARETVGSPIVQQNGIQCFNCKGFGHYAKDYAYHKEKMMMCKQAEQGVPLQAEQADWLEDTDEEIDEHELEALIRDIVHTYIATLMQILTECPLPRQK
ncbi:hypothetical protein Tco_1355568, partial [Tanacetum coccineum]